MSMSIAMSNLLSGSESWVSNMTMGVGKWAQNEVSEFSTLLYFAIKKINAASSCGQVGKKECHKTRSGCSGDRIENATASENNQQDLVFQQNMEIFRRCASIS